nr:GapA-binding peptide SR1P [Gracilibacillus sp. YIM 98692]
MGIVICIHCESVIDIVPSIKVTTFYAFCSPTCMKLENERNENSESA